MLKVKYKIWLDEEGKIFGQGPYNLLRGVKDKGSLSEAAKCMGMSYNKAYNLVKGIEDRVGFKLITSKSGGNKGGGSVLTDKAENLILAYEKFFSECEESIQSLFLKYFKDKSLY
jgi:molybdate transport system regulatory protein